MHHVKIFNEVARERLDKQFSAKASCKSSSVLRFRIQYGGHVFKPKYKAKNKAICTLRTSRVFNGRMHIRRGKLLRKCTLDVYLYFEGEKNFKLCSV